MTATLLDIGCPACTCVCTGVCVCVCVCTRARACERAFVSAYMRLRECKSMRSRACTSEWFNASLCAQQKALCVSPHTHRHTRAPSDAHNHTRTQDMARDTQRSSCHDAQQMGRRGGAHTLRFRPAPAPAALVTRCTPPILTTYPPALFIRRSCSLHT